MGTYESEKDEMVKEDVDVDPSLKPLLWLIRPCAWYEDEYNDCKSIRSRFHQHFVFGEQLDCSQWKRDAANCERWTESRDVASAKDLIDSELKRREARLAPYYNNDIWEHRKDGVPPANWNAPLPEWMENENKHTFLAHKAEEEKNPQPQDILANRQSLCIIM